MTIDTTTLPPSKHDAKPIGAGDSRTHIRASDWNTLANVLDSVRSTLLGGTAGQVLTSQGGNQVGWAAPSGGSGGSGDSQWVTMPDGSIKFTGDAAVTGIFGAAAVSAKILNITGQDSSSARFRSFESTGVSNAEFRDLANTLGLDIGVSGTTAPVWPGVSFINYDTELRFGSGDKSTVRAAFKTDGSFAFNGLVESTSGGFKFPDGTVQTTAGGGGGSGITGITKLNVGLPNTLANVAENRLLVRGLTGQYDGSSYGASKGRIEIVPQGGVRASGTITFVAGNLINDGETITLKCVNRYDASGNDPLVTYVLEFDKNGSVAPGNIPVTITDAMAAWEVQVAFSSAMTTLGIGSSFSTMYVSAGVTEIYSSENIRNNQAIISTVADPGFIVTGMAGSQEHSALQFRYLPPDPENPIPISKAEFGFELNPWTSDYLNTAPWANPGYVSFFNNATVRPFAVFEFTGEELHGMRSLISTGGIAYPATGSIIFPDSVDIPTGARLVVRDSFITQQAFRFTRNGSESFGDIDVDITTDVTASELATTIVVLMQSNNNNEGLPFKLTAYSDSGTVYLTSFDWRESSNAQITTSDDYGTISVDGMAGATDPEVAKVQVTKTTATSTRVRVLFKGYDPKADGKLFLKVFPFAPGDPRHNELDYNLTSSCPLIFEIVGQETGRNYVWESPIIPPGKYVFSFEWEIYTSHIVLDDIEFVPVEIPAIFDDFIGTLSKPYNDYIWNKVEGMSGGTIEQYFGQSGVRDQRISGGVLKISCPGSDLPASVALVSGEGAFYKMAPGVSFETRIALSPIPDERDGSGFKVCVGFTSDPNADLDNDSKGLWLEYDAANYDHWAMAWWRGSSAGYLNAGTPLNTPYDYDTPLQAMFVTLRFEIQSNWSDANNCRAHVFMNGCLIGAVPLSGDIKPYQNIGEEVMVHPFVKVENNNGLGGKTVVYVDYIRVNAPNQLSDVRFAP